MRTQLEVLEESVILTIDDIRLTACDPKIQPFEEYTYRGKNDILHFYYNLFMERKEEDGWRMISDAGIFDFGIMPYLEDHINYLLKVDAKEEGILLFYEKEQAEAYWAMYPYRIKGLYAEDAMFFTKYYKKFGEGKDKYDREYYELDLMIGGVEWRRSAVGAHFMNLESKDLRVIRRFGKEFMKIANRLTKEEIKRKLEKNK